MKQTGTLPPGDSRDFYRKRDPWGYFANPHDLERRRIIVGALAAFRLERVLDIGCGNGFVTEHIPADEVVAVDVSRQAIDEARSRSANPAVRFLEGSIFDLPELVSGSFDAVVITGVLYPHYIGNSLPLVYDIVGGFIAPGGLLASVHIENWYEARFPLARTHVLRYPYRDYVHLLELYRR